MVSSQTPRNAAIVVGVVLYITSILLDEIAGAYPPVSESAADCA
ncbi:MAG: hypothetical protein ACRDQZ_03940 [Mycobacteriales bacterium]